VIDPQRIRVPAACSPLEGIYLLALLLRGQRERLSSLGRLLDSVQAAPVTERLRDVEELLWRLRAILAGADPAPSQEPALLALLELSGLAEAAPPVPAVRGWSVRERRRRLLADLEQGRIALLIVADQCRALPAATEFDEEFMLVGLAAREQGEILRLLGVRAAA
jgi:hypothetical protein